MVLEDLLGVSQSANVLGPQFAQQPVLKCAPQSLNATFCLRGSCLDQNDVKPIKDSGHMGWKVNVAGPHSPRASPRAKSNSGAVEVQSQGNAFFESNLLQHFEVATGVFLKPEGGPHMACCIVNAADQCE